MAKGKRILIIAGIVVVVLALAGYGFGFYYYSRGQVADRYESATYGKFDSYASNYNTTPDGVSDIFLKAIESQKVSREDTVKQQLFSHRASHC